MALRLLGTGCALPGKVVTNAELEPGIIDYKPKSGVSFDDQFLMLREFGRVMSLQKKILWLL